MFSPWLVLGWLISSLLLLLVMDQWLNRHLQGLILLVTGNPDIVMYITFLILLPGIILHELSHWCTAQMLGVHTRGLSIFPQLKGRRRFNYGAVRISAADPFRYSLIGLAPLLTGSAAVLLCARFGLGIPPLVAPQSWSSLVAYLRAPDAPIWLYLIFAFSNAMLPSASDRQSWGPVSLFLGLVAVLLGLGATSLGLGDSLREWSRGLIYAVALLANAFSLTVAVDLLFALLLLALENVLGLLLGRRVEY